MTGTRSRPRSAPRPTTDADGRTKAVLFCPDCGLESPPDGAWRRRRVADLPDGAVDAVGPGEFEGDGCALVCPDCGAVATVR